MRFTRGLKAAAAMVASMRVGKGGGRGHSLRAVRQHQGGLARLECQWQGGWGA